MHAALEDHCSLCPPPKRHGIGGPLLLAIGLHAAVLVWSGATDAKPDTHHEVRLLTTLVPAVDAPAATSKTPPVVAKHPAKSIVQEASASSATPIVKTTADSPRQITAGNSIIPTTETVAVAAAPEQAAMPVSAAAVQSQPGIAVPSTAETTPVELADLNVVCPQQTTPVYPLASRRLHETGRVVLKIALDNTGRILSSEIRQSSGSGRLDRAALETVRSWRCQPARRDGQAVAAVALQRFEFALQ